MYSKLFGLTFCIGLNSVLTMQPSQNPGPPVLINPNQFHGQVASYYGIQSDPNFVFSPFSISYVSDIARIGAKGNTERELQSISSSSTLPIGQKNTDLKNTLVSPKPTQEDGVTPSVTLKLANRVYVDGGFFGLNNAEASPDTLARKSVFDAYVKRLEEPKNPKYGADIVKAVNFQSNASAIEKEINEFVADTTNGHIKELLPKDTLSADMRLVLVNALYFKAPWGTVFDNIQDGVFHAINKKKGDAKNGYKYEKSIKMMRQVFTRNVAYYGSETVKAVLLPYRNTTDNGLLYMTCIMPKDIQVFEQELIKDPLLVDSIVDSLYRSMLSSNVDVDLSLPKFKMTAGSFPLLNLKEVLHSMGLKEMFTPRMADFSGISGDQSLYVSSFLHHAHIEVNQEGTEASAATSMQIALMSMGLPKPVETVVFNNPFLFQIRYSGFVPYGTPRLASDDLILFSGRLADPEYE